MMKTHIRASNRGAGTSSDATGLLLDGATSDEDIENEEMRFGGEGLEGFAHSPRGLDEGDSEDEGILGQRDAGHEEDLGKVKMG